MSYNLIYKVGFDEIMAKPVEFGKFYKLLQEVKIGDEEKDKELQWILAEYEHAKEATSAYDELGQIFCHHGVMELFDYTGVDSIKFISTLEKNVWDYLDARMKVSLPEYMVKSMIAHVNEHNLLDKLSKKWDTSIKELDSNVEDLAKYVVEGIIDVIDS